MSSLQDSGLVGSVETGARTFPPLPGGSEAPVWTGAGFSVGGRVLPVLEYSENSEGWDDELTVLHEEAAGDSHPLDVASRQDAVQQLSRRFHGPFTVLEVGCSSGFLLKALKREFPAASLLGADVVKEPLYALAKELPDVPLLRFDLTQCPLRSGSCDAVVMLNVLEHIGDDVTALSQVYRILKPGGVLVIEVPAGPHLFDAYDKALRHFRRYRLQELTQKMQAAGFVVERKSHLGFLLYPAFAAAKAKNRLLLGDASKLSDSELDALVRQQATQSSKSSLLSAAVKLEEKLGQRMSFPVGIRCLGVGRKP